MAENKTKIDIFSGFLGAGKTTLIKKLIQEAFKGEKIVLIENCLLYTSPSPRDRQKSRMPSSA